jgi:hypothetical protein
VSASPEAFETAQVEASQPAALGSQAAESTRNLALVAVIAGFVVLAALRATLGISFADDASYVSLPLHFAQGARPIVDEMSAQGLGFLVVVPFMKAWTALLGTSGLVLASRLFYVLLAATAGYVIHRALKRSFGNWATAIAVAVVLMTPPYNVMAASYNTVAVLAFAMATALAWQAVRDRSRGAAAIAGVAAAAGALSYPSLVPVAVVLAAAVAVVGWRRRVVPAFLLAFVGAGAVFGGLVLIVVSPHAIAAAMHYSSQVWSANVTPSRRSSVLATNLRHVFVSRWLVPMWILAAVACVPRLAPRARAVVLALIPLAATLLPAWGHRAERAVYFGKLGTASLVVVSAGLLAPAVFWAAYEAVRHRRLDAMRLLMLAAPPALVGFVIVALSTSSGWFRALAFVGLAPLTIILMADWGRTVRRDGGRLAFTLAATGVVLVLLVALFSNSFKDGASWSLTHRIWHGPLAGIATTNQRAAQIAAIEDQGQRWVGASDRVLVFNNPLAYLLVGGRIYTNAVWLQAGRSDRETVDYFARQHNTPDVVFLSRGLAERNGGTALVRTNDPLIRFLAANYRVVKTGETLDVLVRR